MASERLAWPDTVKGLSILWIAYFHCFKAFGEGRFPWPLDDGYWQRVCDQAGPDVALVGCAARAGFIGFSYLGFHGVGVFIVLSGFALSFALSRKGAAHIDWPAWYRGRLIRLYPLYWVAHLVYLLSPAALRGEPIDYRFVLSFLGDRVVPLDDIFYYANAAWWYFGLQLQLYVAFPLLHLLRERFGSATLLIASALVSAATRYLFLIVWPSEYSGALVQGALFTCRLFEFTAGMVLGAAYARRRADTERRLLSAPVALAGLALYVAGVYACGSKLTYVAADALIGCGLLLFMANLATWMERLPMTHTCVTQVGMYSYGLYLLHQPFVIWLGETLRGKAIAEFVALALIAVAVLAVASMAIERRVNAAVARVLG
ncbi:MAG TPA: acyltransferase [Candidatus Kryptonia bacterium]|nr:acyltransferase [Candidatus Kryptonia bacterium]